MTDQPTREPITEDWLKSVGFRWHQFDRQPNKHWLLWLGHALTDPGGGSAFTCYEDLGIELAPCGFRNAAGEAVNGDRGWFCWMRSDGAGRYHRFIHIRHLAFQDEVIALVAAMTGQAWDPANHIHGLAHTPEQAARVRENWARLDRQMLTEGPAWYPAEKDASRGRPIADHQHEHITRNAAAGPEPAGGS